MGTGSSVHTDAGPILRHRKRGDRVACPHRQSSLSPSERGFTLIELMIAITLLAALSTGLLLAMRTGLLTLDRGENRLQDNRRAVSIQKMLVRQIASVMPVVGDCGTGPAPLFVGGPQSLRMVSSYSMTEGARGLPEYVEYQVLPDPEGGFRLVENEFVFASPLSTGPLCLAAFVETPRSLVIARGLGRATFLYREFLPDNPSAAKWLDVWTRPNLPAAVRMDLVPLRVEPGRLVIQSVSVPMRVTRDVTGQYADQ